MAFNYKFCRPAGRRARKETEGSLTFHTVYKDLEGEAPPVLFIPHYCCRWNVLWLRWSPAMLWCNNARQHKLILRHSISYALAQQQCSFIWSSASFVVHSEFLWLKLVKESVNIYWNPEYFVWRRTKHTLWDDSNWGFCKYCCIWAAFL